MAAHKSTPNETAQRLDSTAPRIEFRKYHLLHAMRLQETFYIERAWSTILEHYEPIGEC